MIMPTNPWGQFCSAQQLAFRAACNDAAPAPSRPVKLRVIERLANLSDAQVVFEQAWNDAMSQMPTASSATPDREFYVQLTRNPMWGTLVTEQIVAEAKWRDLVGKDGLRTFYDRGAALFEKFTSKKEHPATAAVTKIVIAMSGLWGVNTVFPEQFKELTLPIRIALIGDEGKLPVTFSPRLDPDGKPIEIPFVMSATEESKVRVTFDAKPVELRFAVDDAGKITPASALIALADELHDTNETLKIATDRIKTLANNTSNLDGSPLSTLKSIRDSVNALHIAYTENTKAEAVAANLRVQEVSRELQRLTVASVPPVQKVTIHANSNESIVIPSINRATGKSEYLILKVCTGDIGSDKDGDFIELETYDSDSPPSKCKKPTRKHEGSEIAVLRDWKLTFSSIHRRWHSGGDVTATIRPFPEAVIAQQTGTIP
jgi:hypothetical protein